MISKTKSLRCGGVIKSAVSMASVMVVVVDLPDPFLGMGGADQLRGVPVIGRLPTDGTRGERVWPNMARRRWSSTGQSSTRCERSCDSEPQLLHEGVQLCGDKS